MNHKHPRNRSRARSPEAIGFARDQRATSNECAHALWHLLRNRQCRGQKFRREYPIPPYTVDFCCPALKLVVEVDGEHHLTEDGKVHDQQRDRFLLEKGYRTLRIPGYAVLTEPVAMMGLIEEAIDARAAESAPSPPAPLPPNKFGRSGAPDVGRGEKES